MCDSRTNRQCGGSSGRNRHERELEANLEREW